MASVIGKFPLLPGPLYQDSTVVENWAKLSANIITFSELTRLNEKYRIHQTLSSPPRSCSRFHILFCTHEYHYRMKCRNKRFHLQMCLTAAKAKKSSFYFYVYFVRSRMTMKDADSSQELKFISVSNGKARQWKDGEPTKKGTGFLTNCHRSSPIL